MLLIFKTKFGRWLFPHIGGNPAVGNFPDDSKTQIECVCSNGSGRRATQRLLDASPPANRRKKGREFTTARFPRHDKNRGGRRGHSTSLGVSPPANKRKKGVSSQLHVPHAMIIHRLP